jgi:serine/threonine protein phosphatase 1
VINHGTTGMGKMKRKIVIGDVHGCFDELMDLLDKASVAKDDLIVSVGDFLDRGPKSVPVLDFFRSSPNRVAIMGNHERKHVNGTLSRAQQMTKVQFGASYGRAVEWLRALPYFYEDDDAVVVHAALVPGIPLQDQAEAILCGTMSGERRCRKVLGGRNWFDVYEEDKPVIFGHKVMGNRPLIIGHHIFGIDTGACHGGYLTAVSVPDFTVYSVKSRRNYWSIRKHDRQNG